MLRASPSGRETEYIILNSDRTSERLHAEVFDIIISHWLDSDWGVALNSRTDCVCVL